MLFLTDYFISEVFFSFFASFLMSLNLFLVRNHLFNFELYIGSENKKFENIINR